MKFLENFSFANPNLGLVILALLPLYLWFLKQESKFNTLTDATLSPLVKKLRAIHKSPKIKNDLPQLMLAILLITIAMMRPRWGYEIIDTNYKGVDIAIAMDVSDSMLAEDLTPNRLGVAKRKISDLIKETPQDRIALISSAGTSFIESPLTLDKSSIDLLASTLQPDLAPLKGSSLSSAIEAAHKVFSRGSSTGNTSRASAMILLTDGEFDQEDMDFSRTLLQKYGITPYAIIFGTQQGAPIPTGRGFKRDSNGKVVISKADLETLDNLFQEFKGKVVQNDPGLRDVIEIVNKGIDRDLKKGVINYQSSKSWKEYFQIPLVMAILLIFFTWRKPLKISLQVFLFLSVFLKYQQVVAEPTELMKEAKSALNKGNFQDALDTVNQIKQSEENHSSTLLKGNILYRLGEFSLAEKEYAKSASLAKSPQEKSMSLFNRGNALLQTGKVMDAKTDYEMALRDNPSDLEIENNLKYIKKLLEEPPSEKDDKQDKQEKEKKQEEDKQEEDKQSSEKKEENQKSSEDNSQQNEENSSSSSSKNGENSESNPGTNKQEQQNGGKNEEKKEETQPSTQNSENKNPQNSPSPGSKGNESGQQKEKQKNASGSENQGSSNVGEAVDQKSNTDALNDQILSQLGSLEEDTSSRQKYRFQKALKELEAGGKTIPKRDW